jgi:hypothetical protein
MITKRLKCFSEKVKPNPFLKRTNNNVAVYQNKLFEHELYSSIRDEQETRLFMANHVFAVWDFMSLLKTLQNNFTCVTVPWIPRENNELCRFINETVVGEESDDFDTGHHRQAINHLSCI